MKYHRLGNAGVSVSRLALGTMYFGDETNDEEAFAILDAFVEADGNFIDTANVYAGGKSEETIGRWFSARPSDVTDRVILATKGRSGRGEDPNNKGGSRHHLHRALDASLRRLAVDVIDLYQLHASDMKTPVEETLGFLSDAISAGKIHYYGLSNFTGWELQLIASTAKEMGIQPPASLQQQYSLPSRESEWEIFPAANYNGLAVLPWAPLAGGFLTGKYKRGTVPEAGTRSGSTKDVYTWSSGYYASSDQNWVTIEALLRIAGEIGKPASHVALSWLLSREGVVAPIVGARTVSQLTANIKATELTLDERHLSELTELSTPAVGTYPYGSFGQGQRNRDMKDGIPAPWIPVAGGSKRPLG